MAVKQGQPWIISDKVNLRLLLPAEHHNILDEVRGKLADDTGHLEAVAMQVHGVDVIARMVQPQPIPISLPKVEERSSHYLG